MIQLMDVSGSAEKSRDARKFLRIWRPERDSNSCRRREREATYRNSMELSGMDGTLEHFKGLTGTVIGRALDARFNRFRVSFSGSTVSRNLMNTFEYRKMPTIEFRRLLCC